jgi:tRNA uridine 5-carboxymethylaminomethyl modification enzyme
MFTSRAEYRLTLREDNADLRLTPVGRELGIVDDERWSLFERKRSAVGAERVRLEQSWLRPGTDAAARAAAMLGPVAHELRAFDLLRRPEVSYEALTDWIGCAADDWRLDERLAAQVPLQVDVQAKYTGYIERQAEEIERQKRHEEKGLPLDLDYAEVRGLSHEVRQRLTEHRPTTVGIASRIPGVTPAAISLLLIHLKRREALAPRPLPDSNQAEFDAGIQPGRVRRR